jgi:hypothetical protein
MICFESLLSAYGSRFESPLTSRENIKQTGKNLNILGDPKDPIILALLREK